MADKSNGSLAKFAGIVALGTVASKILGFLRETSFAAQFGASYATDAYLMAMVIPTLMLLGVGPAVTTTLVPVFADVNGGYLGSYEAWSWLRAWCSRVPW